MDACEIGIWLIAGFGCLLSVGCIGLLVSLPFILARSDYKKHPKKSYWLCLLDAFQELGNDLAD